MHQSFTLILLGSFPDPLKSNSNISIRDILFKNEKKAERSGGPFEEKINQWFFTVIFDDFCSGQRCNAASY